MRLILPPRVSLVLSGLGLGIALPWSAIWPTALADSLDIPAIDIPAIHIPAIDLASLAVPPAAVPAFTIPAIQVPPMTLDLNALRTQLAAVNIDLDELDIDLDALTSAMDSFALELESLEFESLQLETMTRMLEAQKARQLQALPANTPEIRRQLAVWDRAIARVRQGLAQSPDDEQLMQLLKGLYQQQFDYLAQLASAYPAAGELY